MRPDRSVEAAEDHAREEETGWDVGAIGDTCQCKINVKEGLNFLYADLKLQADHIPDYFTLSSPEEN